MGKKFNLRLDSQSLLISIFRSFDSFFFLLKVVSQVILLEDDNKLSTLKKVSTGYTVGAISILRGNACENVRASSNLIAISISDKEFKDIYDNDSEI